MRQENIDFSKEIQNFNYLFIAQVIIIMDQ